MIDSAFELWNISHSQLELSNCCLIFTIMLLSIVSQFMFNFLSFAPIEKIAPSFFLVAK